MSPAQQNVLLKHIMLHIVMHKPRLAIPLDMTELLLEGSERRQRHTPLGLQEVELASFTLRDKDLFDRTSEKSAQLWDDVRF